MQMRGSQPVFPSLGLALADQGVEGLGEADAGHAGAATASAPGAKKP
ncbi:hypothetical protein CCP3SC5AM1_1850003 [Gammaproteobacteria bacterium]